jgi:phosphoribosylanthranilate isomerase
VIGERPVVKICGLTRVADAELALQTGARYLGVIMAGGPRQVTRAQAREIFAVAPATARVVVFADQTLDDVVRVADELELAAVQLHAGATPEAMEWLRARTPAARWAVVRVPADQWPRDEVHAIAESADALVLDAKVDGALGGTGVALPWRQVADAVSTWRRRYATTRLVLAGGLRADRVSEAVRWLSPDVLDVSSGVEHAPGIKDPDRVRAFLHAVEHLHD